MALVHVQAYEIEPLSSPVLPTACSFLGAGEKHLALKACSATLLASA